MMTWKVSIYLCVYTHILYTCMYVCTYWGFCFFCFLSRFETWWWSPVQQVWEWVKQPLLLPYSWPFVLVSHWPDEHWRKKNWTLLSHQSVEVWKLLWELDVAFNDMILWLGGLELSGQTGYPRDVLGFLWAPAVKMSFADLCTSFKTAPFLHIKSCFSSLIDQLKLKWEWMNGTTCRLFKIRTIRHWTAP